ncbi:hypothetical protein SHKM778_41620 [Streptomyces sp. KM77-8]|uniref:Uncharacterized protein n=1 Tax=Streptomyces haneummycinicus TaxID=3074435 RepID=A0AAT9HJS5_9ACTN
MVRAEQGAVEQGEDLLVVGGQGQQRLQRVADLPGQDRRVEALAGHVAQHDERLPRGVGPGVDVVEVTADPFVVAGRAVVARVFHAVQAPQGGRQEFPHERGGDRALLAVEARGRQRGARACGEEPGERLLVRGEGPLRAGAEQDQRAGGHTVPGKRGDDDRADGPAEAVRDDPARKGTGVDPARGHRREALEGLGQPRYAPGVELQRAVFRRPAAQGVGDGVAASDGRQDEQRGVGEVFRRQLYRDLRAAWHVQRRQQGAGDHGPDLRLLPGDAQGRFGPVPAGAVHQPPRRTAVRDGAGTGFEEPVTDLPGGRGARRRDVRSVGEAPVRLRQPGRHRVLRGAGVRQDQPGGRVLVNHRSLSVEHHHRVGASSHVGPRRTSVSRGWAEEPGKESQA